MTSTTNSSISIIEMAADRLWQFQLRKENKAILNELQENERRRKSLLEANQKRFEEGEKKILKLESKITQLEQENRKSRQLWENLKKEEEAEIAELKMQLMLFLHSYGTTADEKELRTIMTGKVKDSSAIVKTRAMVCNQKSKSECKKSKPRHSQSIQSHNVEESAMAERSTRPETKDHHLPKRLKSQSQRKFIGRIPSPLNQRNSILASKLPKLSQGRLQLKGYYEKASIIRSTITSTTEQSDFDFVNSFIRGIISQKTRDKLIGQLQQIYLSKQMKDGRVEIICSWTELGEVVKSFDSHGQKSDDSADKRQSVNHLTQTGIN